jgi:uncharacterized protein involved in exopolysaccharide biosynthesis
MDSADRNYSEDDLASEAPGAAVNPAEVLLHALGRFPLMIVGFTLLGGLCALAIALSQPNSYRSVGMLLVRMGARERQTVESAVNPDLMARSGGTTSKDELLLLMNPALRVRVVEEVGVRRILRPYDPCAKDDEDTPRHIRWIHELQARLMGAGDQGQSEGTGEPSPAMIEAAINFVQSGTSISAQRQTNTIVVSFVAHDAELAQLVATAYLKVCQDRHREFYQTADKFSFVSARLDEARMAADAARTALIEQREKDGVHDLRGLQDALEIECQTLEVQNKQDEVLLESLKKQIAILDLQIADTPIELRLDPEDDSVTATMDDGDAAVTPVQVSDPELPLTPYTANDLMAQLQLANSQFLALGAEYVETSDHYKKESARLMERTQALEFQISQLLEEEGGEAGASGLGQPTQRHVNPIYTSLISQRLDTFRQREAVLASKEARLMILNENRKRLSDLLQLEPVYQGLEIAVAETMQRLAELEEAHSHAATLELIDSDARMSNLLVTQEPYLPTSKQGPDRLKTLLLGIFGGLALGLGTATARQLFDSRLRYPADTEGALGIRILGSVPEQRGWRRKGKKLQGTMARKT